MKISKELRERAKTALRSDDDLRVEYDADPSADGETVVLRRTVWNKAYRMNDREILHQEDIGVFTVRNTVSLIHDLISCVQR